MTDSDGGMTATFGTKYRTKGYSKMRNLINKKGEGYISTGVKIVIAVVIGALILGGIYFMFAGNGGVVDQMNKEVDSMMHHEQLPT